MKKIINLLIDEAVQNADTYSNNGSTWLIFTDDKRWVIELTKEGTLWYNYNFFKSLFAYTSMDVVENQNYITNWVEDNIINKKKPVQNGVKYTGGLRIKDQSLVEDTVINGVKDIQNCGWSNQGGAEDTIQNGVKHTKHIYTKKTTAVEDTIQNGVKNIRHSKSENDSRAENTIQNGVKETKNTIGKATHTIEDTIQNGVKETHRDAERHPKTVEDAIQNGVIHTRFLSNNRAEYVEHTIENGVKKTYSDKIPHEYDWSDQFTEDVEDTIQNGVKHTEKSLQIDGSCVVEDVIQNGIKETHDDVYHHTGRVEGVIKNGVKQCIPSHTPIYNPMDFSVEYRENHRLDDVASVLEKGIKEVQPLPSQEGNKDWGNYYHRQEDRTKPHTQYVNDVIENGKKFKI